MKLKQILRALSCTACLLAVFSLMASPANADLADWLAEVAAGTAAGYTNTGISGAAPITDDIGVYDETTGGGVSYEFIVNAGDGDVSSAFMGSLSAPAGDSAGLKFEQWSDTGTYGATAFGVADYDSGVPHILNQDHQVVYVNDGTDTALYVNGAFAASIAGFSPTLSGVTGLAQAYNHGNGETVDALDGTLLGVAVYDGALSGDEIKTHYDAFVPEPSSVILCLFGASLFAAVRRRR